MFVSTRSYLISGVALLGAGAIAVAPIQPTLGAAPAANSPAHFVSQAVELVAATNPITRILEVWDTSETNFAGLIDKALEAPLPSVQQVAANWIGYLAALPNFADIISDIFDNLQAAVAAPFAPDESTLDEAHAGIYAFLPDNLKTSLGFTTSYATGALIGLVGPIVAPILSFSNSVHAIINNFLDGEFGDAITELINIPANLVDAFLNGGPSLDLGPLLTRLGVLPISPLEGVAVTDLEIAMGGLLSPGGSLFNSLGLGVTIGDVDIPIPGVPAGAIGSLIGLGQTVAKAIGWNGEGNPLHGGIPVPGASAVAAAAVAAEADDESGLSSEADANASDGSASSTGASRNSGKGLGKSPRNTTASSSSDNPGGASAGHSAAKNGKGGSKRRSNAA